MGAAPGSVEVRVLLEEHGRDLYWFVVRLTPGADPRLRESIVEVALKGVVRDERLPIWPAALRRAYQQVATAERSGGILVERRAQAASTAAWAALSAEVASGASTWGDAEVARLRLPLDVLAALELVRLGFDDGTIAAILGAEGDAGELRRGRLARVLRQTLAWAAEGPRALRRLITAIGRGGGEPAAVLAIAARGIDAAMDDGTPGSDGTDEPDQVEVGAAVRAQLGRLGRALERRPDGRVAAAGGRLAMLLYNRHEVQAVERLREDLRRPDIYPWVYDRDALGDRPIRDELDAVLLRAGAFVVAIGEHGMGGWQGLEISAAMRRAVTPNDCAPLVVAVLETLAAEIREPATGLLLSAFRKVDLRSPPRSARIGEIQAAIVGSAGMHERGRSEP